MRNQDPTKSKFDNSGSESDSDADSQRSDGRDSEPEEEAPVPAKQPRRSRFSEPDPPPPPSKNGKDDEDEEDEVGRENLKKVAPQRSATREEIALELNWVLKHTLTEILLEVTSEGIDEVAKETYESAKRRHAKNQKPKNILSLNKKPQVGLHTIQVQ